MPSVDARNPRTASRELPAGALSRAQVLGLCAAALALFLVAVFQLDPIVRWLWPIPVVFFVVYPYLKRVTWLCHVWLGASLGLAPIGAWVAVTGELPWQAWTLGGAVALWVAGFDLFYSLFDLANDREQGLHSWATRFGEAGRVHGARACFTSATVVLLALAGLGLDVGVLYWLGVAAVAALLALRAFARPPGRPAPARRRLLHRQRRHQHRLPLLRPRRRAPVIRARALGSATDGGGRCGRSTSGSSAAASSSSRARTAPARRRCCASSPASPLRPAASSTSMPAAARSATSATSRSSTAS